MERRPVRFFRTHGRGNRECTVSSVYDLRSGFEVENLWQSWGSDSPKERESSVKVWINPQYDKGGLCEYTHYLESVENHTHRNNQSCSLRFRLRSKKYFSVRDFFTLYRTKSNWVGILTQYTYLSNPLVYDRPHVPNLSHLTPFDQKRI